MKNSANSSILFMILITLSFTVKAQDYKSVSIYPCDGIRSAQFTGLVEVSNGYIAMGHIDTFYNGQYGTGRIWVVKLDVNGSLQWSKFYRDDNPDLTLWGRKLARADNDGVYILAQKASETGLVIKLDKNGNVLWKKNTIVMPNSSYANDIITTADEGCLVVGNTVTSDTGAYAKYYKNGSLAFQGKNKPENVGKINYTGVDISADGGYYLVGIQNEYNPYPLWRHHLLVHKISGNGDFIWGKAYHGGDEISGDKKKSEGYAICGLASGGFIAGGRVYKESILNAQGFVFRGNDSGDTLWTKYLFEESYPYPDVFPDNLVSKILLNKLDPGSVYVEFVEGESSSGEKNFLATMSISDGDMGIKQTGYQLGDQQIRSLIRVMSNGQPCFIGGEFFLNYPRQGLVLWTTPDGLWIPPRIAYFENGTNSPQVITRMEPHIEATRVFQVSPYPDFSTLSDELNTIQEDTVILHFNGLPAGHYYARVGINGNLGNRIWSDVLEFDYYAVEELRYTDEVSEFSSEYGGGWSVNELIGYPDVYPDYGDHEGAWTASSADGQREFLQCKFAAPAPVSGVVVFETFNPGAIDTVYVRNSNTMQWQIVYSATAEPAPQVARALNITFPATTFPVSEIRLAINSPAVPGWNEIDAIGLIDAVSVATTDLKDINGAFSIIPNPASDQIVITWDRPLTNESICCLYTLSGQELQHSKVPEGSTQLQWSIGHLPSGNYWVLFQQGSIRRTIPIIKQ